MTLWKNKIKFKNIIMFTIVFFVFLTFELIFLYLGYDFHNLKTDDLWFMTFVKYFVMMLFFVLYYHKYFKEKIIDFGHNIKSYIVIGFKDWITGFIIMYVINMMIINAVGNVGENEETVQSLISATPWIAMVFTTFLAPFIEEMVFRKTLQDCFHNKYFFMITSGILFGLVHVLGSNNPGEYLLILSYGAVGFMFAHSLSKTDNIFVPIMLHMFHNGLLTLISIMVG